MSVSNRLSIDRVRRWLAENDQEALRQQAKRSRRLMSLLTALTFDLDPLIARRAVEALGLAAAIIAISDPEFVRGHLRRLFWMVSDESGSIGWRAPEAIGEIICAAPDLFAGFIPPLVSLLEMEAKDAIRFQAGTLWAIGRVAQVAPGQVTAALPQVLVCLNDPQPQVRVAALWCLTQMGQADKLELEK